MIASSHPFEINIYSRLIESGWKKNLSRIFQKQVSRMPVIEGGLFSLQDSTTKICMSLMVELILIPFRYSEMAIAILYSPALCGDLQIKLPVLESKLTVLLIPGLI